MPRSQTPPQHEHLTVEERHERGREARKQVPRSSHADWAPAPDRPDPVDVLTAQDATRLQSLVPIRHGRMAVSPFTFYRGAAAIMAGDLASTPVSGLDAQLCGDAHLSNYGAFASAERNLVFDVNDFDETLPGPWEWDVKRLGGQRCARRPLERLRTRQDLRRGGGVGGGLPHGDGPLRRAGHARCVVRRTVGRQARGRADQEE